MFTHDRGYVNARSSLTPGSLIPSLRLLETLASIPTTLSSLHFANRFIRACYKSASIEIVVISASSISYDATVRKIYADCCVSVVTRKRNFLLSCLILIYRI